MGAAYFIVLERKIEGLDSDIDGKWLARQAGHLDVAARELGVRPLSEFFSIDPEEAADFMECENVADVELPPLQYFSAQDGLATVRALLPRPEAKDAIHDLKDCERILSAAAKQGIGWYLACDF